MENTLRPLELTESENRSRILDLMPDAGSIRTTAGWNRRPAVYAIIHKATAKIYIGATVCLKRRISYHLSKLRGNKHDNSYLQNAWNMHGEQAFVFVVIEECAVEKLQEREAFWMAKTDCADRSFGYNLDIVGVHKRHSEETKRKISIGNMGKVCPAEARRKIGIANTGRDLSARVFADWDLKARSERLRLKWLDPVFRQKIIARIKEVQTGRRGL